MKIKTRATIRCAALLMTLSAHALAADPGSDGTRPLSAAPQALTKDTRVLLSLRENHLLSQDITAWAASQGMRVLWSSQRDYLIYSTIQLRGNSRDEVLDQLGRLFRSENYGLVIRLYEKNNVLVIDSQ